MAFGLSNNNDSNNESYGPLVMDDEETLPCLLASSVSDDGDDALQQSLQGLPSRVLADHYQQRKLHDEWRSLLERTRGSVSDTRDSDRDTFPPHTLARTGGTTDVDKLLEQEDGKERQLLALASQSSTSASSSTKLPVALETDMGKHHMDAVRSVLGLTSANDSSNSNDQAVQLTLGALRSISPSTSASQGASTSTFFSSLVGTRALLVKVMEYNYEQRIARLQVLAECLRLEMEIGAPTSAGATSDLHKTVKQALQDIDDSYTFSHGSSNQSHQRPVSRGLFRILLQVATQPDVDFSREQLWPAQHLTKTPPKTMSQSAFAVSSLVVASSRTELLDSASVEWKDFVRQVVDLKAYYVQRERLEAMEALLTLVYHRMDQGGAEDEEGPVGVHRFEFLMLLLALFRTSPSPRVVRVDRLTQLRGLICVEALSLWKVFITAGSDNHSWVTLHPILKDLVSIDENSNAKQEIRAIVALLRALGEEAVQRRLQGASPSRNNGIVEVPESLVLLSFGLFLSVAYRVMLESPSAGWDVDGFWKGFGTIGQELTEFANDQCQAFDYLFHVMSQLIEPIQHSPLHSTNDSRPYDFLPVEKGARGTSLIAGVSHEDPVLVELSAPSLMYASVGRELLATVVSVFQDTILSVHHPAAVANVGMLCSLASSIFGNSPALCQRFWDDWDKYTSPNQSKDAARKESLPLCAVMDAAYSIASTYVQSQRTKTSDQILEGITPLLMMASVVAYDSRSMRTILTSILPSGLIRMALVFCTSSSIMQESRRNVLESVYRLVKVGRDDSTRKLLRNALEDNAAEDMVLTGPRLLMTCAMQLDDDLVPIHVCFILSELAHGSSETWAIEVARAYQTFQGSTVERRPLDNLSDLGDPGALAHVRLIHSLVKSLSPVVMSERLDEDTKVGFMDFVDRCFDKCCSVVCNSLSSLSGDNQDRVPVYATVQTAISSMTDSLLTLRPIIDIIASARLRDSAARLCTTVVSALSSSQGLGDAILYYAESPVLLSVANVLDSHLRDAVAFSGGQASSLRSLGGDAVLQFLAETMSNVSAHELDMEMIRRKGWIHASDVEHVFPTALCAIRLLNAWARTVEDMVLSNGANYSLLSLGPHAFLCAASTVPPACRDDSNLWSYMSSAKMSNLSLMARYLNVRDSFPLSKDLASGLFDLLFVISCHSKFGRGGQYVAGDAVLRLLSSRRGSHFVQYYIDSFDHLAGLRDFSEQDDADLDNCLRCLRFIAAGLNFDSDLGLKLLGSDPAATVSSMRESATKCISYFLQCRSKAGLLEDDNALDLLLLANGCLSVMVSLWKHGRRRKPNENNLIEGTVSLAESQTQILPHLASFVFEIADVLNGDNPREHRGRCILSCTISLALEILSTEMAWTSERPNVGGSTVLRAIQTAVEQDLSRLVVVSKYLFSANAFGMYSKSLKRLSNVAMAFPLIRRDSLSRQHEFSLTGSRLIKDWLVTSIGYDVFMVDRFFASLSSSSPEVGVLWTEISSSRSILDCEVSRICAWKRFTEFFSLLLQRLRQVEPSHSILSMTSGTFASSMIREISTSLYENMRQVELAQMEYSPSPFTAEALLIARACSGLLLYFTDTNESRSEMSRRDWNRNVSLLSDCSRKLVAVVGGRVQDWQTPVVQVMASIAVILSFEPDSSSMSHEEKLMRDEIHLDIVSTTCEVIRVVDRLATTEISSSRVSKTYRDCLSSCVYILTNLMAKIHCDAGSKMQESRYAYCTLLINALRDFSTVSSLVRQVCGLEVQDGEDYRSIATIVNFFGSIAACGDPNAVTLLVDNDLTALLSRCSVYFRESAKNASCGYVQIPRSEMGLSSATVGTDDPVHGLWNGCMRLLSSALRAYSNVPVQQQAIESRLVSCAIDMLRSNKEYIQSCLNQCTATCPSSGTFTFTSNALQEAASTFSVASALCSRKYRETFQKQCPILFENLMKYAKSLMVNISCFVGASAASRELFRAVEEFERTDSIAAEEQDYGNMSPALRLVSSSGVRNANHDAIRFSHFVSRASSAVTEKETRARSEFSEPWKQSRNSVETDPHSLSSLERNCRSSVSSAFAFDLEQSASECLFFTVQFLWRNHPSSYAFQSIPEDMIGKVDAMPLVRPGMVISFQKERQSRRSWRPEGSNELVLSGSHPSSQRFGEVLYADTVNRCWYVRPTGESGKSQTESVVVSADEITGLEEISKRSCVLSYVPAPESSSDLESSIGPASVGHLILTLRWCQQFRLEQRSGAAPAYSGSSLVERLADLASAFLGTELSLHRQIGSQLKEQNKEAAKVIAAQVMDLYSAPSDQFDESGVGMVEWKMTAISPSMYEAARRQVQPELEEATAAIAAKEKESNSRRNRNIDTPWISVRRDSAATQSPFRGVVGM